ncbi:hypothetical protein [Endozoicomonas sp. 2B-B]
MDSRFRGNDENEAGNDENEAGNDENEAGNDENEAGNDGISCTSPDVMNFHSKTNSKQLDEY